MEFIDQYGSKHFDGYALKNWLNSNIDLPLYVAGLYLAFVFLGPSLVTKVFGSANSNTKKRTLPIIKCVWAVWNLSLSIFSFYGTTRVAPRLLWNLKTLGLHDTLCVFRPEEFYTTNVGFAIGIFTISKVLEFGDTFFLILQGKQKLPFLQWFHHTSMFFFVWYAFKEGSSIFIVAASLNYAVHTIMYFYFAMAEAGFKNLVRPFAMYITLLQLVQMVGVIFSSLYVIYYQLSETSGTTTNKNEQTCSGTSMSNARLQLIIYTFFLYLFGQMFLNNHIYNRNINKNISKTQ